MISNAQHVLYCIGCPSQYPKVILSFRSSRAGAWRRRFAITTIFLLMGFLFAGKAIAQEAALKTLNAAKEKLAQAEASKLTTESSARQRLESSPEYLRLSKEMAERKQELEEARKAD